ncbi:hypothetical protein ACWT_5500 [Actinoplanes sp. SE50]|nr:hypothetical protein ACPL_5630 [Actinoplanes sp. SE50/110]ATO84915.1 hypothetical protein ACWT_5500 [Actinoplanes sp. SE50]SLM02324.1 hypothetical protein ACSP50_5563 [Actinoplanes sp. SE50/110]
MFIGLRTRDDPVDVRVLTCRSCGWTAPQERFARTVRFTVLVPLFRVRPRRNLLRCGHCRGLRAATPAVMEWAGSSRRSVAPRAAS